MTDEQLAAVNHVQMYAPPRCLMAMDPGRYRSDGLLLEYAYLRNSRAPDVRVRKGYLRRKGPFPRTMTITLRCSDWGEYSNSQDADLECMLDNRHWESLFGGVRTLRMELEVEEKKKAFLTALIQRLKGYVFDIGNGEELVAEADVRESTWAGLYDKGPEEGSVRTTFYVATVTWKMRKLER